MRLTFSSTARRSTACAAARSFGGPHTPGPTRRIPPKPSRWTVRSPSATVPAAPASSVRAFMTLRVPARRSGHRDGLRHEIALEALGAAFRAVARVLHAAERDLGERDPEVVDPDHPGLDPVRERDRLGEILRERVRG